MSDASLLKLESLKKFLLVLGLDYLGAWGHKVCAKYAK